MSNAKRIQPTTLSSDPSSKPSTPVQKPKSKTIRLNLTLSEPSKEWCPVFNYESLVKAAKERMEKEEMGIGANGTADPFNEGDPDDSVRKLAKSFEEKYGSSSKSSKRCRTYTELGEGYDENDSFIDNTEAMEEGLGGEVRKKHDGYYINCERFDKIPPSDHSDGEEHRILKPSKKSAKRPLITSEEEDSTTNDDATKKSRSISEENLEDSMSKIDSGTSENKDNSPVHEARLEKKSIQREKPKLSAELKKPGEPYSSVSDVIESVVSFYTKGSDTSEEEEESSGDEDMEEKPAERNGDPIAPPPPPPLPFPPSVEDENSTGSGTESQGSCETNHSETGKEVPVEPLPPPLPEETSAYLKSIICNLKESWLNSKSGKKPLASIIDSYLLSIEKACRSELSPANRRMVFAHLAFYVPRTQSTLMKRAKKLLQKEYSDQIERKLQGLKETIDSETQNKGSLSFFSEGVIIKQEPEDIFSTSLQVIWTERIKIKFIELVTLWVKAYKIKNLAKIPLDTFLTDIFNEKVIPLWPLGAISLSKLKDESMEAVLIESKKLKIKSKSSESKKTTKTPVESVPLPVPMNEEPEIKTESLFSKAFRPLDTASHIESVAEAVEKVKLEEKDLKDLLDMRVRTTPPKPMETSPSPQKLSKPPLSLKHRILQESAKGSEKAPEPTWSITLTKPESKSHRRDDAHEEGGQNLSPTEAERLHEETAAATDILSQLITDQVTLSLPTCASDDKVQMQLNEVMQDLATLNQMSEHTHDLIADNDHLMSKREGDQLYSEGLYSALNSERRPLSGNLSNPPESQYYSSGDVVATGLLPSYNPSHLPFQLYQSQNNRNLNSPVNQVNSSLTAGVIRSRHRERFNSIAEYDPLAAIHSCWPTSDPEPPA